MYNLNIKFGGFYYSQHDQYIDYAIESYAQDEEGNISEECQEAIFDLDYNKYRTIYLNHYTDMINEFLETDIKFVGIDSPRFYNYSTDELIVNIDNKIDLYRIRKFIINNDLKLELIEYLQDITTSKSGYAAFYSYDELIADEELLIMCYLDIICNYLNAEELDQYLDFNNVYEDIGLAAQCDLLC